MLKKIFILFLAGVFIFSLGFSYADAPLSLDSLIKEAKANSPDILAAKKRWEASLARAPQAKSLDNPSLGLKFEKIPRGSLKLDKTMASDRMLSLSQMLPWFGKLSLKERIAVVEAQMYAAEYKGKELEIINQVKKSYYDLFMNYKDTELNRESLGLLKGIAKIAEAKYQIGTVSQEELLKIDLEIAKLDNNIANLKEERSAKETRINALLNREPESVVGMPQLEEDLSFSKDINSLFRLTLENQPELLTFSYAIEKNKYAQSLAQKSFFPDLMSEITLRGITAGTIGAWDLMLAFTVPLWFWTKQRYEVKEAIANLEEAKAAYTAMKNKALAETKDLAVKIEIVKNRINLYKTSLIPIAQGSLEASQAGYTSGKGDFMLLLDSERMLIATRMDYYRALVDYNVSLSDLDRAVGLNSSGVEK